MIAPASLLGKRGKCPHCQTTVTIGGGEGVTRPQAVEAQPPHEPLLAPFGGRPGSLLDDLPPLAPAAASLPTLPANNPLGITPESQRRWREAEAAAAAQSQPRGGYSQPMGTPLRLMIPAIGMILISVVSIGFQLFQAVDMATHPERPPPFAAGAPPNRQAYLIGALAGAGAGMLVNLAVIVGAVQMIRMKGWETAKAGALAALIPCCSFVCLNIPLGVWALIVLHQDEVRRRFS